MITSEMTSNSLLKSILSEGVVSFHSAFGKAFGDPVIGIYLSQFIFFQENATHKVLHNIDGQQFIQKTADEWYDVTSITPRQQALVREKLRSILVLHEKKQGLPALLYQRIDIEVLIAYVRNYYNDGNVVIPDGRRLKMVEKQADKDEHNVDRCLDEMSKQMNDNKSILWNDNKSNHRNDNKSIQYIESLERIESIYTEDENFHQKNNDENDSNGESYSFTFKAKKEEKRLTPPPPPAPPRRAAAEKSPAQAKAKQAPKTVDVPETHRAVEPLVKELLTKKPYLQKSPESLAREMAWFFSKPVAFCLEHIQSSLDTPNGCWQSLKFANCEDAYIRWVLTQQRIKKAQEMERAESANANGQYQNSSNSNTNYRRQEPAYQSPVSNIRIIGANR